MLHSFTMEVINSWVALAFLQWNVIPFEGEQKLSYKACKKSRMGKLLDKQVDWKWCNFLHYWALLFLLFPLKATQQFSSVCVPSYNSHFSIQITSEMCRPFSFRTLSARFKETKNSHSQLSNLLWMPNSVSKGFDTAMRTGSSRRLKRYPTTYRWVSSQITFSED